MHIFLIPLLKFYESYFQNKLETFRQIENLEKVLKATLARIFKMYIDLISCHQYMKIVVSC